MTVSTGTLSVYVWKNGAYVKYYEATGVPITDSVTVGNETFTRDGRVYIQSHWGSGVVFTSASFVLYSNTPIIAIFLCEIFVSFVPLW